MEGLWWVGSAQHLNGWDPLINIRHGKTEGKNYVRLISKRNDIIRKDLNGRNQDCVRLKRRVIKVHTRYLWRNENEHGKNINIYIYLSTRRTPVRCNGATLTLRVQY